MSGTDIAPTGSRILVWDMPLRLFHWLLVAAIAVAFVSAEQDSPLNRWHMMSGWIAAVLISFRVIWGFVGGENARFSGMLDSGGLGHHIGEMLRFKPEPSIGHNPLGWLASLLLIIVSAAAIWTGALIVTGTGESGEDLHEVIGWSLLALVALHITAVMVMSALTRENLVRAIITGSKPAARHPDASNASNPSLIAYLVGLVAIAAATFAILRIDPQAFVPRTTEAAENGGSEASEENSDRESRANGGVAAESDEESHE